MSAQESSICYRIEWPEGWPQTAERPRFTTSFEVAKTRCQQGAAISASIFASCAAVTP